MNILIVRLGALGDIVHAIPAAAALRAALPDARIDWLVEAKHRAILDLVTVIDRVVRARGPDAARLDRCRPPRCARPLRRGARPAGADEVGGPGAGVRRARVAGSRSGTCARRPRGRSIRRPTTRRGRRAQHMSSRRTCACCSVVGVRRRRVEFPLARRRVARARRGQARQWSRPVRADQSRRGVAEQALAAVAFGEVAAFLREVRGLPSVVLWGPGEEALAQAVVAARTARRAGAADRRSPTWSRSAATPR